MGCMHALCRPFQSRLLELDVGDLGYLHPFRNLPGLHSRRSLHRGVLWLDHTSKAQAQHGRRGSYQEHCTDRGRTEEGGKGQGGEEGDCTDPGPGSRPRALGAIIEELQKGGDFALQSLPILPGMMCSICLRRFWDAKCL